jgi:Tfp pilus assembly protein PilV
MKDNILKKIKNKKEAGFTIVESLVAIFILVLSITGPMAFTQSGLRAAFVSRDQITAFYLAQDAIEYVKNIRDNNSIKLLDVSAGNDPVSWIDGLSNCNVSDISQSGCTIDTLSGIAPIQCPGEIGCLGSNSDGSDDVPLKIKELGSEDYEFLGIGTSGDEDSIFSREIKMIQVDPANPNEVEINVFVRWNTNETIGSRQIVVKEYIYNWAAGF